MAFAFNSGKGGAVRYGAGSLWLSGNVRFRFRPPAAG